MTTSRVQYRASSSGSGSPSWQDIVIASAADGTATGDMFRRVAKLVVEELNTPCCAMQSYRELFSQLHKYATTAGDTFDENISVWAALTIADVGSYKTRGAYDDDERANLDRKQTGDWRLYSS